MNKNIKLAVAGAVLALSASANAGIIIPAGDWTLDINGNVNAYATTLSVDRADTVTGDGGVAAAAKGSNGRKGINTGLLPAWIGFTGKTRQNDLDVEFTISLQPGVSENTFHGDGSNGVANGAVNATVLNRQTYVSFGDKSWGSIKLGKDIGIYASDAILNDMTLLGVGGAGHLGSGSAINTTTGGIGSGYQYAAWKGQVAYTTPNWNGFQATAGIVNPNMFGNSAVQQGQFGFEAKGAYSWTGDVAGKVWVSGASYDVDMSKTDAYNSKRISAYDIGVTANVAGFGLTAYAYDGRGNGSTALGLSSFTTAGKRRDGNGGYVQATYVIPTKTKIGLAYGESNLDRASGESASTAGTLIDKNERWTVGAYHPLTKHLNLVAEYTDMKGEAHNGNKNEYSTASLGAILFF